MRYTTPVPNEVFDVYLRELKPGELKVLLVVVRQTLGYINDSYTKRRREQVWLSRKRIAQISGLSPKAISQSISGLLSKGIILVCNPNGESLSTPIQRARASRLIFRLPKQIQATYGKVVTKGNQAVYISN